MSITPQDFLRSAEEFAAIDTSEVNQRNGISRVYYAAYHRSCEFIKPDGADRGVGSHRGYIEQLRESASGSLARRIGVSLGAVYVGRITADYKLSETISQRDFSTLLNRTREIFKLFDTSIKQTPVQHTSAFKILK